MTVISGYDRDVPATYVHVSEYYRGQYVWSLQATMLPSDAVAATVDDDGLVSDDGDKYGWWISHTGDSHTGNLFMVTATHDIVDGLDHAGSVYMYRGRFSKWTHQQYLTANEPQAGAEFGEAVAMDLFHPRNVFIGSGFYSSPGYFRNGAAYMFKGSPTGRFWTEHQRLTASDKNNNDYFGIRVAVFDDFAFMGAMGDDDKGENAGSVYIFREFRGPIDRWSQQQIITPMDDENGRLAQMSFGEFISVYRHVLVVGQNQDDDGATNAGSVYVWQTMPHVHFHWWSQVQKLRASDEHAYRYFGTYTSTYGLKHGNLIATGAFGEAYSDTDWDDQGQPNYRSGSAYIFIGDGAHWSQQQKFLSVKPAKEQYFSDPYLFGSALIIRDTREGYIYADYLDWDCLVIEVGDHFGDGWDKATLFVTAPDGTTDQFAPYCDSHNPFTFRYCPAMINDDGDYSFEVAWEKSKFIGEIYFSIYNERTNKMYYGDYQTSITFNWQESRLGFEHVLNPADKLLHGSCKACPIHPKPVARHLKGSNTASPTITSSPTITYGAEQWDMMVMGTSNGLGWYGENYTGTAYYIYDEKGIRMLRTETLCGGELAGECLNLLEDGDYILRVGGALDPNADDHTWQFCGVTGTPKQQLTFRVTDGECTAIYKMTAEQYCEDILLTELILRGHFALAGVPPASILTTTIGLSDSVSDFDIIISGVENAVPALSESEAEMTVELDDSVVFDGGLAVAFTIKLIVENAGYNGKDTSEIDELVNVITEYLEDSTTLRNYVSSTAQTAHGSKHLVDISTFELYDIYVEDYHYIDLGKYAVNVPTARPVKSPSPADASEFFRSTVLEVTEYSGFTILAVGLVVAGLLIWRISKRRVVRKVEDKTYHAAPDGRATDLKVQVKPTELHRHVSVSPRQEARAVKEMLREHLESSEEESASDSDCECEDESSSDESQHSQRKSIIVPARRFRRAV